MALKSYNKQILQDSWYEERSKPLKGVLVDYGHREYELTSNQYYMVKSGDSRAEKQKLQAKKSKGKASMLVQRSNIDIVKERSAILSDLSSEQEEEKKSCFHTTNQDAYGIPIKQKSLKKSDICFGGGGGRREDRGKSVSGSSGEVRCNHPEPQKNTEAQRSWIYTSDPKLTITQTESNNNNNVSNTLVSMKEKKETKNYRKKETSITTVPRYQGGIFADD